MSTRRMRRSVAVAATVAALALSSIALPAAAKAPKPDRGPAIALAKKAAPHGKSAAATGKSAAAKGKSAAAKQRKAARFNANGTVVAVGTDTLTVAVKGGDTSLRSTESVITVPVDARIQRDDATAALSQIVAGDHVAVGGVRRDGALVASRVNASSPEPVVDEPTEDATDTGTEDPTEDATDTVTDEPTETNVL